MGRRRSSHQSHHNMQGDLHPQKVDSCTSHVDPSGQVQGSPGWSAGARHFRITASLPDAMRRPAMGNIGNRDVWELAFSGLDVIRDGALQDTNSTGPGKAWNGSASHWDFLLLHVQGLVHPSRSWAAPLSQRLALVVIVHRVNKSQESNQQLAGFCSRRQPCLSEPVRACLMCTVGGVCYPSPPLDRVA